MTQVSTRLIEESGFRVTLPLTTSFRLSECLSGVKFQGTSPHEMDLAWFSEDCLYLLELKGDGIWSWPPSRSLSEHVVSKVTDTLLILASVWSGTKKGGRSAVACRPVLRNSSENSGCISCWMRRRIPKNDFSCSKMS